MERGRPAGIVRAARRPAGWSAPGPAPAGPRGRADLAPGEGEDLCYLSGDWRIFQRLDGHRFSLDDLCTAWYGAEAMAGRPVRRAADIGCGIGSVLQMIAWRFPEARCVGVEAQALSAALARRSVAWNGAEDRIDVRLGDLRDPAATPEGAVFDLVTGTPPYIPLGRGVVSSREQCGPCRFETRGGIEDYCKGAARLLAPEGRFAVCQAARDGTRVEAAAAGAALAVLSRKDVTPREGRAPLFTLWLLGREAAGLPRVDPPLVVRDARGAATPDYQAVRAAMGMPPAGVRS